MAATTKERRDGAYRRIKATALGVSLVFSALLMAVGLGSAGASWLVWISILPLFAAIRSLRPATAAVAGGFWGFCLYVFSVSGAVPAVAPTVFSFILLIIVSAAYAGFGSLLTRTIGYNPILLAFGWILVEIALRPAGLHQGLLGGTPSAGAYFDWIARVLGYAVVVFVVALVNASFVSVLGGARLRIPPLPYRTASRDSGASLMPQTFFCLPLFAIRPSRPRAPPIACLRG